MPRGNDPVSSRTETPAGLRDMAARTRRAAWGTDDLTVARMNAFAEELEARAAALTRCAAPVRPPLLLAPRRLHGAFADQTLR